MEKLGKGPGRHPAARCQIPADKARSIITQPCAVITQVNFSSLSFSTHQGNTFTSDSCEHADSTLLRFFLPHPVCRPMFLCFQNVSPYPLTVGSWKLLPRLYRRRACLATTPAQKDKRTTKLKTSTFLLKRNKPLPNLKVF